MEERLKLTEKLPDGHYKFMVVGIPEKFKLDSGHVKRIWILSFNDNGEEKQRRFHLFGSQYAPIVLAIGGAKEGDELVWDDERVDGRYFECDLEYVKSKDNKYENPIFKNCEESIPF